MNKKLQQLLVLPVMILMLAACGGDKKEDTKTGDAKMKTENGDDIAKGKESFKAVYMAIQSGDLSKLGDQIDSNVIEHDPNLPGGQATGLAVSKQFMTELKTGFPDVKIELINIVGEGDMLYAMTRLTGTNTGPFSGMPPTNKKVDCMGVDVVKFKNGKAIEHWSFNDNITMMRQLGLMPAPPPAAAPAK